MSATCRTPEEWGKLDGHMVYDPDGWRVDGKDFSEPITREEYDRRAMSSTTGPLPAFAPAVEPREETVQVARNVMGDSISEEEAVAMAADAEGWMDRVCELHTWAKGRLVTALARAERRLDAAEGALREIERIDQEDVPVPGEGLLVMERRPGRCATIASSYFAAREAAPDRGEP